MSKEIIIFDDFDRISEDDQNESFKIFNIIHNKVTVVFVGSYEKIYGTRSGNYLSKIIDKRISLPYELQTRFIFNFKEELNLLQISDEEMNSLYELENIFIEEERTLRDKIQFYDMVNQEFFISSKLNTVDPIVQLTIIYLYLFHSKVYESIKRGEIFVFLNPEEEYARFDIDVFNQLESNSSSMKNNTDKFAVFDRLLNRSNSFGYPLLKNNIRPYLILDTVLEATTREVNLFLSNYNKLKKLLIDENESKVLSRIMRIDSKVYGKYDEMKKSNIKRVVYDLISNGVFNNNIFFLNKVILGSEDPLYQNNPYSAGPLIEKSYDRALNNLVPFLKKQNWKII